MARQMATYEQGCEQIVSVPPLHLSKGTDLLAEPGLEYAYFALLMIYD